jgi:DNA ligase-1
MTTIHPTLYSKDSKNKVRVWYMEQSGSQYRTVAGLQDGEKVVSEYTTAKPKNVGRANATTAEQQALSEIQSKYLKQLKTGYHKDIGDIHTQKYIEPMLAQKYRDRVKDVDFESGLWAVQPKLNGQRCIATKHGLFTRKGETYVSVPHISESLKPFFEKYPDAFLDGELFNFGLRQKLNELATLTRKTKNVSQEDLERSRAIVQYHVYDGGNFGIDVSETYQTRILWLEGNLSGSYIYLIDTYYPETPSDFEKLYNGFVENGQEGAMLRHLGSSYEHKRSKWLLKVKPEDDSEAIIEKCHYGTGNWSKVFKTFTLNWNGKVFDATLKCSMEEAEVVTNNPEKWIGKKVTFLYNGLTGLSVPNFARVDILNCEPST